MFVHNYASRLDIHLNFCLQTEISGTSLPDERRGSSDFLPIAIGIRPHEEEYRVTGKEAYIMKNYSLSFKNKI
ncbi:hypothetical protein [Cognataquiflexum aquatile]|uniref:hypothetical protein n=1 Tax=Cognataquiflexum aquatile TaxID=2249427 RepID=UPI000DEA7E96|nr:hypothetical protein [Cognataquiflexum aquatile]